MLGFAAGALLVSAVLVGDHLPARAQLPARSARASLTRQAFADANVLNSQLATAGTDVGDVLGGWSRPGRRRRRAQRGRLVSSSLDVGAATCPRTLPSSSPASAGTMRIETRDGPRLLVAVPVRAAGVEFYEIAPSPSSRRCCARWPPCSVPARSPRPRPARASARGPAGAWCSPWTRSPAPPPGSRAGSCPPGCRPPTTPTWCHRGRLQQHGRRAGSPDRARHAVRRRRQPRAAQPADHPGHQRRGARRAAARSCRRGPQALTWSRASSALPADPRRPSRARPARRRAAPETAQPVRMTALVREVLGGNGRPAGLRACDPTRTTVVRATRPAWSAPSATCWTTPTGTAAAHAGAVERRDGFVVLDRRRRRAGGAAEDRERIFERFARGPRAARRSLPGAGLGLAIVGETAARHGGRPGRGGPAAARGSACLCRRWTGDRPPRSPRPLVACPRRAACRPGRAARRSPLRTSPTGWPRRRRHRAPRRGATRTPRTSICVTADDILVPRARDVAGRRLERAAGGPAGQLAEGPTAGGARRAVSTALPPDRLRWPAGGGGDDRHHRARGGALGPAGGRRSRSSC